MPSPHELLLPLLAASATFMVLMAWMIIRHTFVGLTLLGTLRRRLTIAWDGLFDRFRDPKRKLMVLCWRRYSWIVDVTTNRRLCAALHRRRAAESWTATMREAHGRMADRLGDDSLVGSELNMVKIFATLPPQMFIHVADQMARRFHGSGFTGKEFGEFLFSEWARAGRDPAGFAGHAERFRKRFGFSLFRRLKAIDGSRPTP